MDVEIADAQTGDENTLCKATSTREHEQRQSHVESFEEPVETSKVVDTADTDIGTTKVLDNSDIDIENARVIDTDRASTKVEDISDTELANAKVAGTKLEGTLDTDMQSTKAVDNSDTDIENTKIADTLDPDIEKTKVKDNSDTDIEMAKIGDPLDSDIKCIRVTGAAESQEVTELLESEDGAPAGRGKLDETVESGVPKSSTDTQKSSNIDKKSPTDVSQYVFAELTSLEAVQAPVKSSTRIKYLCVAVCSSYVALGTNTGVLYVFEGDDSHYKQSLTTDKDAGKNAVIHAAFCPSNHNVIGYALSNGNIGVSELSIQTRGRSDRLIRHVTLLKDASIQALQWDSDGARLLAGTHDGCVCAVNVLNVKKEMFATPAEIILRLDSAIVQIDSSGDRILISTETRSYFCDRAKHQFKQIGKKIRDTKQGGCFYKSRGLHEPIMYCARPGSRMWEVNERGDVVSTHQFKTLLDVPPTPHVSLLEKNQDFSPQESIGPQSLSFTTLHVISERYLVAICDKGVFVFNPAQIKLVLWVQDMPVKDIVDTTVHNNSIYFLLRGNVLRQFSLLSVPKLVSKLLANNHDLKCAQVLSAFQSNFLAYPGRIANYGITMSRLKCLLENLQHEKDSQIFQDVTHICEVLNSGDSIEECGTVERKHIIDFSRSDSNIFVGKSRSHSIESIEADDIELVRRISASMMGDGASSTSGNPIATIEPDTVSRTSTGSQQDGNEVKGLATAAKERIDKAQTKLSGLKAKILQRVSSVGSRDLASLSPDKLQLFETKTESTSPVKDVGSTVTDVCDHSNSLLKYVDSSSHTVVFSKENGHSDAVEIPKAENNKESIQITASKTREESLGNEKGQSTAPEDTVKMYLDGQFEAEENTAAEPLGGPMTHIPGGGNLPSRESAESLVSLESTEQGSKEGSQSADDVSVSSGDITVTATAQDDAFPRCDVPGLKTNKSKKKKAKLISFDEEKITSKKERRQKMENSQNESDKGTVMSAASGPRSGSPLLERQSEFIPPKNAGSSQSKDVPQVIETEVAENSLSENAARRLSVMSLNTMATVKDKLSVKAKSLVQSIKDTKEKISKRSDFVHPPLDVASESPAVEDEIEATRTDDSDVSTSCIYLSPLRDATECAKKPLEEAVDEDERAAVLQQWVKIFNELSVEVLKMNAPPHTPVVHKTCKKCESNDSAFRAHKVSVFSGENAQVENLRTKTSQNSTCSQGVSSSQAVSSSQFVASSHAAKDFDSDVLNEENELQTENRLVHEVTSWTSPVSCEGNEGALTEKENPTVLGCPSIVPEDSHTRANLCTCPHKSHASSEAMLENVVLSVNPCITDRFEMPCELFTAVKTLCTMCFELRIFGGIFDVVSKLKAEYEDVVKSQNCAASKAVTSEIKESDSSIVLKIETSTEPTDSSQSQFTEIIQEFAKQDVNIEQNETGNADTKQQNAAVILPDETNGVVLASGEQNDTVIKEAGGGVPAQEDCVTSGAYNQQPIQTLLRHVQKDMALFLKIHFYAMDVPKVRDVIVDMDDEAERYMVWVTLVECLQELAKGEKLFCDALRVENVQYALDLLRTASLDNQNSCLGCLIGLFKLVPKWTLHLCSSAELGDVISPIDVIYMCRSHCAEHQHIVDYTKLYVQQRTTACGNRNEVLALLCRDKEVYEAVISAFLLIGQPNEPIKCVCAKMPLPKAHKIKWADDIFLEELLSLYLHPGKTPAIRQLCLENGYWPGYLRLLSRGNPGDRNTLATVAMQLSDAALLDADHTGSYGFNPESAHEWQLLLGLKQRQHTRPEAELENQHNSHVMWCLNCGSPLSDKCGSAASGTADDISYRHDDVTWEKLATLLVRGVGGKVALEMLKNVTFPEQSLPFSFYQFCVIEFIREQQQRQVLDNLIGRIDSLFVARLPEDSPAAQVLIKPRHHQGSARTSPCDNQQEESVKRDCHLCHTKLLDENQNSVALFPCGHVYHESCHDGGACQICQHQHE